MAPVHFITSFPDGGIRFVAAVSGRLFIAGDGYHCHRFGTLRQPVVTLRRKLAGPIYRDDYISAGVLFIDGAGFFSGVSSL